MKISPSQISSDVKLVVFKVSKTLTLNIHKSMNKVISFCFGLGNKLLGTYISGCVLTDAKVFKSSTR